VRTKELTSIGGPSSFSFKSATSPLSVERELRYSLGMNMIHEKQSIAELINVL
jgi:hypothetical protein